MGNRRPHEGFTIKSHVHQRKRVLGITCFSFFVIIVSLLVGQDEGSAVESLAHHHRAGLERGKVIGSAVAADDLYKAYKEIQQDYHEKAFSPNQPWKILNQKDGVEIAMLQHASDPTCPYVRMTAVMPTSVQHCWNFLKLDHWDETMPKMDPFYEGVSILGNYVKRGVGMVLARKRTKRILAFGKRDFLFISVSDLPLQDGTWVSGSVSVVTSQYPRQEGYTRAFQDSIAFYKPLGKHKSKITIVCRIDLNDSSHGGSGGNIPMWLYVKTIGASGAHSVMSMRRVLAEEEKRRRRQRDQKYVYEGMRFSLPWQYPELPSDEDEEVDAEEEERDTMEESMRFSLPGKLPILPNEDAEGEGEKDVEGPGRFPSTSKKEGKRTKGVQFQFPWLPKKDGDTKEEETKRLGRHFPFARIFRHWGNAS
jgi:hypothetical protein